MDVLWQLIDHQATLDILAAGLPVRLPRSKLEGYRFIEVATRRSITPRVVYLRAFEGAGKSWVDLIRALRAVTLFGEGFGNLIAPRLEAATTTASSSSTNKIATLCNRWRTVPKDRDYLAASSYDLARILCQEGSATCNPMKLAPGIFWSQSATAFELCARESRGNNKDAFLRASALLRRPCDRLQVLLPNRLSIIPRGEPPPLHWGDQWILAVLSSLTEASSSRGGGRTLEIRRWMNPASSGRARGDGGYGGIVALAAWLGKAEMVYELVKHGGADVHVEDAEGKIPGTTHSCQVIWQL
ncbi:hypothetical protein B0H66DRAFT_599106 [Apodospora peruviana]|uniref:Uncharacterized protein n=1 Tax=Apodospora peruviana TaxID=516989 RepID=A0AAE0MA14_9PEZI|nr:hypothetical protein B0H66DRAFT_599106 [Apodospora peruviana]